MKKFTTAFFIAFSCFTIAHGQTIRNSDISVEITSPATNVVVPYGDSVIVSFNYTNHGPDVLPAGDTLFFSTSAGVIYSALLMDLQVNGTIMMNDFLIFWNPTEDSITADICVLHIPQSSVQYQNGSSPATTYIDPDTTNDLSCISAHFEGLSDSTTAVPHIAQSSSQLSIFPNPATSQIQFSDPTLENWNLSTVFISDISGRVILKADPKRSSPHSYSVDISNLVNGIYFLEVNSQDGKNSQKAKFVISK